MSEEKIEPVATQLLKKAIRLQEERAATYDVGGTMAGERSMGKTVAAFNIISTLVMVVNDKKGDIAILRTLGATPGTIMRTFMVQGTVIGVVGTAIGAVVGILAALNVSAAISALEGLIGHKFLNADVYFIDYLPSQVQSQDVVMVCAAALVLSFLATLYPAWRAARTQPAEALRYE